MSQSITGNPSPAANVLADRVETGLNKKNIPRLPHLWKRFTRPAYLAFLRI